VICSWPIISWKSQPVIEGVIGEGGEDGEGFRGIPRSEHRIISTTRAKKLQQFHLTERDLNETFKY
jgi:hypothetical protein